MMYFRPGFVVRPPLLTNWNNSDKTSNISLSGALLTATAIDVGDGAVRATVARAAGKYYVEINCTPVTGGDTGAGLANLTAVLGSLGSAGAGGFVQFRSGNVYKNGSAVFNNGGMSGGGVLKIAYDAGGHLAWLKFAAGNWNNNAANDPVTGVGGQDTSGFDSGGLYPVWMTGANGDAGVLNAGASSFSGSVPAGFTAWNG